MKLLVVEDNERVAAFLHRGLTESGHSVAHVDNGRDGALLAGSERYDVIIMDRMLPGQVDGIAIIEQLRQEGNKTPILILSALGGVDERVRGLRSGGDDYLVKPFSFEELLARLDALQRRNGDNANATVLTIDDLRLDVIAHRVTRAGKSIALQPREFKLLRYLMLHANQVVTRTMLFQNVWEYHFDPQTNVIDVQVSKLRQKIDSGAVRPLLRTIRNSGYMLTDHD